MSPMKRRARAAQACIDRFAGKPYEPGKADCVQLAKHALHHLGRGVGKLPIYSGEIGAVRALKKMGFRSLIDAVDAAGLQRIAPAMALAGDIIALPADGEGFDCALTVAAGNGRVVGFKDGVGQVLQPNAFVTAWRVI